MAAWSSVAAVLLLVVMVAGLAGRGGNSGSGSLEAAGGPTTTTLETPASLPSDAGASTEAESPATTAPAGPSPTTRATRPRPSPSTTGPQAPGAGGGTQTPAPTGPAVPTSPRALRRRPGTGVRPTRAPHRRSTTRPPRATPAAALTSGPPSAASPSEGGSQDAAPPSQPQKSATPAPAGPALRVGIITGDAAQEAGFRAYVNRLNQAGGIRGHAIELVPVSSGAPAPNTIATVNLGSQPVAGPGGAPGWVAGPLLETLTATEDLLTANGAVFSFASAPERQGHLAADALFPSSAAAGTKAVIYVPAGAGPLRDAVPAAIKAVLKQRNVANVQVVTYDAAAGKPLTAADAAFVSLDPAAARAWVAQAKAEGYRPPAGVAGIYSLADDALAADLPEGARVVSPYVVPAGDEGQAIRSAGAGNVGLRPPRLGHRQVAGGCHLADGRRYPGRGPGRPRGAAPAGRPAWLRPTRPAPVPAPAPPKASSSWCSRGPSWPRAGSAEIRTDPSVHQPDPSFNRSKPGEARNEPSVPPTAAGVGRRRALRPGGRRPRPRLRRAGHARRQRQAAPGLDPGRLGRRLRALRDVVHVRGRWRRVRLHRPAAGHPVEGRAGRRLDPAATRAGGRPAAVGRVEVGRRRGRGTHRLPRRSTTPASTPSTSRSCGAAARRSASGPGSTASSSRPTPPRCSTSTPPGRRSSWPPASTPMLPRSGTRSKARARPIHLTIPLDEPWVPLRILGLGKGAEDLIDANVFLLTPVTAQPAAGAPGPLLEPWRSPGGRER